MSNLLGDKPEWWLRDGTWAEFCATDERDVHYQLMIEESEYRFGLKIADYLHIVHVKPHDHIDDYCDFIDRADSWLKDRKIDCIAFDTDAVGKLKDLSNAVLFKSADDAMLFKLTWL